MSAERRTCQGRPQLYLPLLRQICDRFEIRLRHLHGI